MNKENEVKEEIKKPIIIDGVDVSECEWLSYAYNKKQEKEFYCGQDFNDETRCENRNCNLKRNLKQLKKLKAENERLKKEVSDLNFYIDSYKITWEIDKKEQYKQALEDVREIAYTTDFDIRDIQKICNEVLKDE